MRWRQMSFAILTVRKVLSTKQPPLESESHEEHHDAQVLSLSKLFDHHLSKGDAEMIMRNEDLVADLMKWKGGV